MSILYCICQGRESITCLTSHLTTFVLGYYLRQASLTSRHVVCFTLALLQQKMKSLFWIFVSLAVLAKGNTKTIKKNHEWII